LTLVLHEKASANHGSHDAELKHRVITPSNIKGKKKKEKKKRNLEPELGYCILRERWPRRN